jgi:hypothetical protein
VREIPRQVGDCEVRGLPMVNPRTDVAGQKSRGSDRMGADVRSKRPRSHTVALRFARGRPGSQGGIVRGVASCRDRFPGFPTGS